VSETARKNRRVCGVLCGIVFGMVGMSYAAVPLYDLFCRVTGYAGTTQVADKRSETITSRPMKIRFDALANNIDWAFQPAQLEMVLKVGENGLAFYRATNRSDRTLTGTATFNVTPLKVGAYFNKVECFCFTEQTLKPGETIEMPVAFFVDPEIAVDPNLNDVKTITLSYTFFPVEKKYRDEGEQKVATNVASFGEIRSIQ
jgi:cytochrome c oxidase assembly protein subunit 11